MKCILLLALIGAALAYPVAEDVKVAGPPVPIPAMVDVSDIRGKDGGVPLKAFFDKVALTNPIQPPPGGVGSSAPVAAAAAKPEEAGAARPKRNIVVGIEGLPFGLGIGSPVVNPGGFGFGAGPFFGPLFGSPFRFFF